MIVSILNQSSIDFIFWNGYQFQSEASNLWVLKYPEVGVSLYIRVQLVWNSHQGFEKEEIKTVGVFKAQDIQDNPDPIPIWNLLKEKVSP